MAEAAAALPGGGDRAGAAVAFLAAAGWGGAAAAALAGDASARRYWRLTRGAARAVLMDAPPGQADRAADFVAIAAHLRGIGLSAPEVLAAAPDDGFLLLEDFGDALFARLAAAEPACEATLYEVAAEALAVVQAHPAPPGLPDPGPADWAAAAALALDAYAGAAGAAPGAAAAGAFTAALAEALDRHGGGPRVLILRDYHAENLIWLPGRAGAARAGLLDFQLAQMGNPAYDLVSLVQDARRDLGPGVAARTIRRFADSAGSTPSGAALAVWGAQRALRILGVFARLCTGAGKPGYLALMPRVWGHLQENLAHPALAPLAAACAVLPPPTPALREEIARRCRPPAAR